MLALRWLFRVSWLLVWCVSSLWGYFQCMGKLLKIRLARTRLPSDWGNLRGLGEEVMMHSLQLRSGELFSTFLKADYFHKLFGIFLPERFVYSHPFIYLFNHLFISVWTHRYLLIFYTLSYNPLHFIYFLVQIVQALETGGLLSWLLCHFDIPIIVDLFFLELFYFLALQDAPGSSWMFLP